MVKQGVTARKIQEIFNTATGARGGGKENKAEGGGGDLLKIEQALAEIGKFVGG
jgi:alanyl-tRNA synthetase